MRRLALALVLTGCTCSTPPAAPAPHADPAPVPAPAHDPDPDPAPDPDPDPVAPPPARAETRDERIAEVEHLTEADRERLRATARHLREGRRLARTGDHAAALAAFEAGLELAPTDGTLLCEAGLQAHRAGLLDRAETLLERGAAHASRPSTEGACLYNLGRVFEDRHLSASAADCYEESLEVRPNETVSARLRALRAAGIDEDDEGWDEEEAWVLDVRVIEGQTYADLDAMCTATRAAECTVGEHYAPPQPSAELRELVLWELYSRDDMAYFGYLVARSDRGWRVVERVTESDATDSYGRLEASESVDAVRFEGDQVIVEVSGHVDEPEGEAEAYWECESEHEDDHAAQDACFEAAIADLPEAEHWSHTHTYRLEAGTLVPI